MSPIVSLESSQQMGGTEAVSVCGDEPFALKLELGLAMEPIVDLSSPTGEGLYQECLARLLVADVFVLKGSEFIGAFECEGCIGLLDEAVIVLALDHLAVNPALRLGCNISPYTLADREAWDRIVSRIAERSWLALRLTLEITESAPLDAIADVVDRLDQVKAYGCRIALDDFGAGFALPRHLPRVDISWDIIKIDRSFLSDLRKTPSGRGGLASIVAIAGSLAPLVVVEGIETEAHLERARISGGCFGQGWMFEGKAPGEAVRQCADREASAGEGKSEDADLCPWHRLDKSAGAIFTEALTRNDILGHLFPTASSSVGHGPSSFEETDRIVPQAFSLVSRLGQALRAVIVHLCTPAALRSDSEGEHRSFWHVQAADESVQYRSGRSSGRMSAGYGPSSQSEHVSSGKRQG